MDRDPVRCLLWTVGLRARWWGGRHLGNDSPVAAGVTPHYRGPVHGGISCPPGHRPAVPTCLL